MPLEGGQGRSLVVTPGFCGSADTLSTLIAWLKGGGYNVRVAKLERNVRGSGWAVDRIIESLEQSKRPAILLGHSRGGQQSRIAAARRPELIRKLITLGAPLQTHVPRHFALRAAVESLRIASRAGLYRPEDWPGDNEYAEELQQPFTADVDWTTIWSRNDGFVAWQACRDPAAVDLETDCSHRGLVESVPSYQAIRSALAD